ncbi:MAG: hypothetical protein H7A44_11300 [Opitutaceae bacterium]|nr:hypothetical protein [Cephaloticoccus sp.]MCP5531013.1 hypothetical protein [Opitutaceae bacterium]
MMKSETSNDDGAAGSDWKAFLQTHSSLGLPEINLADMQPRDRLVVETLHTRYGFEWQADGRVILTTNRMDRPHGEVRINGCTFGQSSTIKPRQLFCGGNLEYVSENGRMIHRTTAIRSLLIMHVSTK